MKIVFPENCNLDKRKVYYHTRSQGVSLKEIEDGTVIAPAEIVVYSDLTSKGEEKLITSVIDKDGVHYTTDSPYFREELTYISDLMDGDEYEIRIKKQISKAGRTFTTCELV